MGWMVYRKGGDPVAAFAPCTYIIVGDVELLDHLDGVFPARARATAAIGCSGRVVVRRCLGRLQRWCRCNADGDGCDQTSSRYMQPRVVVEVYRNRSRANVLSKARSRRKLNFLRVSREFCPAAFSIAPHHSMCQYRLHSMSHLISEPRSQSTLPHPAYLLGYQCTYATTPCTAYIECLDGPQGATRAGQADRSTHLSLRMTTDVSMV